MNAHTSHRLLGGNDRHDAEFVDRFIRIFHRSPSTEDINRVRRADARLRVRMQHRARRRLARLISAP